MGSILEAAMFARMQDPLPAARMTQTTAYAVVPSAYNNMPFQQIDFDTTGSEMASTSTGNLTCPRTGIYLVTGCAVWANAAAGLWFWAGIGVNGSTSSFIAQQQAASQGGAGWPTAPNPTGIFRLQKGDYLTLYTDTNAATNQSTDGSSSYFGLAFLGPA